MNERKNLEKNQKEFLIPESEVSERFSRSSGPGGQYVQKTESKVELRWRVDDSQVFTLEEKEKIKKALKNRLTKEGELIVVSQKERSQAQNRKIAFERLNDLVREALMPEEERIPTTPTEASIERRLKEKREKSEKKKWRSKKFFE